MKKILLITLINFSCFSMELNYPEKQIPIFSNNSNQPLFLDSSAIEYSDFLRTFFETRKEFKQEDIKFDLSYEDLKNAIDLANLFFEVKKGSKYDVLINKSQELTLENLINTYWIIQSLRIKELDEYLSSLFNKPEFIRQLSHLKKKKLKTLNFIKTKNFLPGNTLKPLLKNVEHISFSPDGSRFFVIFKDNSGLLFDANNKPIGETLDNVFNISWSPNKLHFFVEFINSHGRFFNINGNFISNVFNFVDFISWSPDGSKCFLKLENDTGHFCDIENGSIEERANNVFSISWSPDSLSYFIIDNDNDGILYDISGRPKPIAISDINNIYWKPDSSLFLVKTKSNTLQIYNTEGDLLQVFKDISNLKISPDGSQVFITFINGTGQLFDSNLNKIGNFVQNVDFTNFEFISWSPDSSKYFIKFKDNTTQLFDNYGNPITNNLSYIFSASWSYDSSKYLIQFKDSISQLYDNNGNLLLNFYKLKKAVWKHDGSMLIIDSDNKLHESKLHTA